MKLFGDSEECKKLKYENEGLKSKIISLKDENESLKRENGSLNTEYLRLKEQNLAARDELSKSFSEIQRLKESIEPIKEESEHLKSGVVRLKDENESLKRENSSLNTEYLRLKEQNLAARDELSKSFSEIQRLENSLQLLREQYQLTINPAETVSHRPSAPTDIGDVSSKSSYEPVEIIDKPNFLNYPVEGVCPNLDSAIREQLLRLQELYPGCADNLKLCVVPSNYHASNWLAFAVKNENKIVLNQDKWSTPSRLDRIMAEDVITHEFGHFVYWKLNDFDQKNWNAIWEGYKKWSHETSPRYDDLYALKNSEEGFADAFTAIECCRLDNHGTFTSVPQNFLNELFSNGWNLVQKYRSQALK